MKTKNMKRTDWRRLLEKSYAVRDCAPWGCPGRESILRIHKVSQPLWVKEGYGRICIADAGHSWVQVACQGQPYWLTAMFDREDRFLQIYFDIARPPCFDDPDDPTFEDLLDFCEIHISSRILYYSAPGNCNSQSKPITFRYFMQLNIFCHFLRRYPPGGSDGAAQVPVPQGFFEFFLHFPAAKGII